MRNTLWDDFKLYVLRSSNTLNHLLAINIALFILFGLLWVVISLFTADPALNDTIRSWLLFPASPMAFLYKPWSIVTYQFMHDGFFHILFNMMVFWFAGRIFREFLGDKKLLSTYLLGGMAGAVFFMLAFQLFPLFAGRGNATLAGASASVLAVLAAIGTLVPNYSVSLILIGSVRLIYIVLVLVVVDLLSLGGNNAGGHFAHLGGALWGFTYIRFLQRGTDLGSWLTSAMDSIANLGLFRKKPNVKVTYYNERGVNPKRSKPRSGVSQEEVDSILDKIARSGYDSLSQQEKDVLFRASKE